MRNLFDSLKQFKSDRYEVSRILLKSRQNLHRRIEQLQQKLTDQADLNQNCQRLHNENRMLRQQLATANQTIDSLQQRTNRLPEQPNLPNHSYPASFIALCVQMAKRIGFRAVPDILRRVFDFLGIEAKIPDFTTIRTWMCRLGVHLIEQPGPPKAGDTWIADHSIQIGREKLFLVARLRQEDLPEPGKTLSRSKLQVIAIEAGENWKRDDVRAQYDKIAKSNGAPSNLLTDGAVELHETVDALQKHANCRVRVIRDLKHKAANILEKVVGGDERFKEFQKHSSQTRSRIQQTELAALTPPSPRSKARFMNLGPLFDCSSMAWYHLNDPTTQTRMKISEERFEEKLGWLRDFQQDLGCWQQCYRVMDHILQFVERHACQVGMTGELTASLCGECGQLEDLHSSSRRMWCELVELIASIEGDLKPGERVWLLSDNLESLFGGYKQLEGQHSKGGFTSLIAALPVLVQDVTEELVREGLASVPVKRLKEWTKEKLTTSLRAGRQLAYREARLAS